MSQRDVIDRVRELRRYGSAWWANDPGNRFSLGGNQGKFSAARIGGRWFYPNAAVPSTHIFKPNPRDLSDAGDVEAATMRLSRLCGIPTPRNQSMLLSDRLGQERCYIIERFDRKAEHGRMIRLRCEDMLQAMGRGSEDKYETTASDCLELLDRAGPDGELAYQWLERLAFNAYSGNSDAHAKNYSLMLGGRIALAPAYDEVCTRYWPRFDQEMAMPIAGERYAENVEPKHWERFARSNGFDSERVAYIAETMRNSIREHMDEATKGMDPRIADRLRQTWTKTSQGGEKAAALPDLDAIEAKRR
jgi:serine/threonine-protein kinase HipA